MRYFAITTLGCKVNRYESEALSEQFIDQGWHLAREGLKADLCIVNTCTVTGKAAMQSRQAVRRLVRDHQGALVLVTGCYAQVAPEVFDASHGIHYVVGNAYKDQIPHLAYPDEPFCPSVLLVNDISAPLPFQDLPVTKFGNRTRPFLKIQDGCDASCTYCIVPRARGRNRSLRPEIVVKRIENLKKSGYAEVVLCGIHLGQYGEDLRPACSLLKLLRSIDTSQSAHRVRLSSIEPGEISEELVREVANSERVCPHLHIPLQSGDDEVLRRMNRPYSSKFYMELVQDLSRMMPDVAIGVDVLVGFPGETDKAFENTCRLIDKLPLAYLHVFPFSVQKGTPAERLKDHLPSQAIKNRCQYLRAMGQAKRRTFCERFIGASLEVLVEGKRDPSTGQLKGFTRNYVPVLLEGPDQLMHRLVQVRLTGLRDGMIFGLCLSIQ